jgi:hypothetical protein
MAFVANRRTVRIFPGEVAVIEPEHNSEADRGLQNPAVKRMYG